MNPAASLLLVGRGVRESVWLSDAEFNFMPACGCSSSSQPREHMLSWVVSLVQPRKPSRGLQLPCRRISTPPGRGRGLFTLSNLALAVLYCIWTLIGLFPLRIEIRSVLLIILSLVPGTLDALSACICILEFNHETLLHPLPEDQRVLLWRGWNRLLNFVAPSASTESVGRGHRAAPLWVYWPCFLTTQRVCVLSTGRGHRLWISRHIVPGKYSNFFGENKQIFVSNESRRWKCPDIWFQTELWKFFYLVMWSFSPF